MQEPNAGNIVIAVYRPKDGKEEALLDLVRGHVPALRELGLATDRPAVVLRAGDGTILEIFEWVSAAAVERAHHDPAVAEVWARFESVCTWVPLSSVPGADRPFPHFAPVDFQPLAGSRPPERRV